jgi:hypothetical protein
VTRLGAYIPQQEMDADPGAIADHALALEEMGCAMLIISEGQPPGRR